MRILGRAFFTYLIPVLLFGCVSANKIEVSDSEFEEQLGRGSLRLTCGFSCSGRYGANRPNMKALHDLESWLDLSKRVYSIGFDGDQGYYYLGRAAEGFGFHDAALTYYRLAKSSITSCDYLFDICDGLVFPDDIDRRVQNLSPNEQVSPIARVAPNLSDSSELLQSASGANGQNEQVSPIARVAPNLPDSSELLQSASGANGQDADFTADTFIRSVIAGQDFEGQEIILSGYVLNGNSSGSGLINLGTLETYQSSSYDNFISIYESPISLPEGMPAVFRVKIRSSSAVSIGGTSLVIIETVFSECLSC